MSTKMFVISSQDESGRRYDVSRHSLVVDAEVHLARVQDQLMAVRLEEKETFNPKSTVIHQP